MSIAIAAIAPLAQSKYQPMHALGIPDGGSFLSQMANVPDAGFLGSNGVVPNMATIDLMGQQQSNFSQGVY
jgi:hypothetical protein